MAYKKSIGTKMNDLDLCLEVVSGHVNYCITFAIECTRGWMYAFFFPGMNDVCTRGDQKVLSLT